MQNTWTTPTVTVVAVVGQLGFGGGWPGDTPGGGMPSGGF
jgi:hypothetical protein